MVLKDFESKRQKELKDAEKNKEAARRQFLDLYSTHKKIVHYTKILLSKIRSEVGASPTLFGLYLSTPAIAIQVSSNEWNDKHYNAAKSGNGYGAEYQNYIAVIYYGKNDKGGFSVGITTSSSGLVSYRLVGGKLRTEQGYDKDYYVPIIDETFTDKDELYGRIHNLFLTDVKTLLGI